jgi:3-oxoacyl-[acyl-carrier protein] reductase
MTRLAVVSGGGTGIGRATAGMLAGEGYDVIIAGRRPEVLADAVKWIGPQASAVTADVSDPDQVPAVSRRSPAGRSTSWSTTPAPS